MKCDLSHGTTPFSFLKRNILCLASKDQTRRFVVVQKRKRCGSAAENQYIAQLGLAHNARSFLELSGRRQLHARLAAAELRDNGPGLGFGDTGAGEGWSEHAGGFFNTEFGRVGGGLTAVFMEGRVHLSTRECETREDAERTTF